MSWFSDVLSFAAPVVGTLVGGPVGTAIGTAVGGLASARGNADAQAAAVDRQYDYNTNMANTVYQRAVEDMTKAGLNPILAYGNQSPVGAGVSTSIYDTAPVANNAYSQRLAAISAAMDWKLKEKEAKVKDGQYDYYRQLSKNMAVDNQLKQNYVVSSAIDADLKKKRLHMMDQQIDYLVKQGKLSDFQGILLKAQADWVQDHPNAYSIGQYGKSLGPVVDSIFGIGSKIFGH